VTILRIGSRGSLLALWQAEHVKAQLEALGHRAAVEVISTTGDRTQGRLESVGGKGAFLKEIEEALLAGSIDLAVHSLKDVPVDTPPGLTLCATLERADPRDALVSARGMTLAALPAGSRVGTTSLRRRAQLLAARPDLDVADLRGNVDTRLRRLREGGFDAILVATAGMTRLGRASEITERVDPQTLLPAPGQGAIVLECRLDDEELTRALAALEHHATARAVTAERALLGALGGGCNVPLGAYALVEEATLWLRALVASEDGTVVIRSEGRGVDATALGRRVADELRSRGARELLGT
jgi:hydroxymethylbilane synthase